ncbi:hypothetical protein FKM82_016368 [Ascaphus truei]
MQSDTLEEINLSVVFCPSLLDSSVDPLAISQGNTILQGSFHDLSCHHLQQPLRVISWPIEKPQRTREEKTKSGVSSFISESNPTSRSTWIPSPHSFCVCKTHIA